MERKRPLISTLLFIGIFLVGVFLVIWFTSKALNDEQTNAKSYSIDSPEQLG